MGVQKGFRRGPDGVQKWSRRGFSRKSRLGDSTICTDPRIFLSTFNSEFISLLLAQVNINEYKLELDLLAYHNTRKKRAIYAPKELTSVKRAVPGHTSLIPRTWTYFGQ